MPSELLVHILCRGQTLWWEPVNSCKGAKRFLSPLRHVSETFIICWVFSSQDFLQFAKTYMLVPSFRIATSAYASVFVIWVMFRDHNPQDNRGRSRTDDLGY